jgi:sugar transferase (PEP-CTERM/EpsH1 system associated)
MNLLFVAARFPYPPIKGDQVVVYNRLKLLGKKHRITLLCFYQDPGELDYLDRLKPYCEEIITVKRSRQTALLSTVAGGLLTGLPLQVCYYHSRRFHKELKALLSRKHFDVIHTYMIRMAEYTKDLDVPKVLDLIDSMQLNLQRRADMEKYPLKAGLRREFARVRRYENFIVGKYDLSLVVSESDKEAILSENERISVINNGVDTNKFRRLRPLPDNRVMIFTGNMGYFPNRNAVLWFLDNCFPLIRSRMPDATFIIAGSDPGKKIKTFHDGKSVIVKGFVDSMVEELNGAQVSLAPMQSGSGIQNKILEAMACELPVVATTLGRGTIRAENREHILVADEPAEFAEACSALLTNYPLARRVGKNARKLVDEAYSWESSVKKIEAVYASLVYRSRITATEGLR